MARQRISGGQSSVTVGMQTVYGTRVSDFTQMIQNSIPFTQFNFPASAQNLQSESIQGGRANVRGVRGRYTGEGNMITELIPQSAEIFFDELFANPAVPNIVQLGNQTVAGALGTGDNANIWTASGKRVTADWPGKIHITFDRAGTPASGNVLIKGNQRRNRFTNEADSTYNRTIAIDNDDIMITTDQFFSAIRQIVFPENVTNVAVQFQPDTHYTEFTLNPLGEQSEGMTFQAYVGTIPYIVWNAILNSMEMTIGDIITANWGWIYSNAKEYRLIDNLDEEVTIRPTAMDHPGRASNFPSFDNKIHPGYGSVLFLGQPGETLDQLTTAANESNQRYSSSDRGIATENVSLNHNNNYEPPGGRDGSPYPGRPIPNENGRIETNINTEIYAENSSNPDEITFWQDTYESEEEVPILLRSYGWKSLGRQEMIEARIASGSINESPELSVNTRGQLTRPLNYSAFPTPGSTDIDQITFRVYKQSGYTR